jgi:hypothetical protein
MVLMILDYVSPYSGSPAAHAQVLLRVSLSVIVHLIVPGGDWTDAIPLKTAPSLIACTLRSGA